MNNWIKIFIISAFSLFILTSCNDDVTPKERAFFRIDIPPHDFVKYNENSPFSFYYADYSVVQNANNPENPNWLYIDYPEFDARIYVSYFAVNNNIAQMINDAHELAFKHIAVANDIQEKRIGYPSSNVYGMMYSIKGAKVASPINFYATDSTSNFIRGALYFNNTPQNDSLAPVINSIEKDIMHIMKSLKWVELPSL